MMLVAQDLGVRHVFSESAQNTLETFEEILDDIDYLQQTLGKDAVLSKIIETPCQIGTQRKSFLMI